MFHRHKQRAALLFTAVDAVFVLLAFGAAYRIRAALPLREFYLDSSATALALVATLAAVLGAGRATGAYGRLAGAHGPRVIVDTARQTLAASLALLAFLYLLNLDVPVSRMFLGLFFGCLAVLQLALRVVVGRFPSLVRQAAGALTSAVVVGDGEKAVELAAELDSSGRHGMRLLAILDCGDAMGPSVELSKTFPVRALDALPGLLVNEAIDEVVFVVSGERLPALRDTFALCDEHGVRTRVAADFFPHVHSRVDFDRFGDRPLLTFSVVRADEFRLLAKRVLDAAFAAVALVALCFPMLAVALLVKLTSKGPVLFRQQRCGLNGRLFACYKFRSMIADAESRKAEFEHLNEKTGPAFKIRDDPRLTRIGQFLRRYSIDEWPQFWNVLRGEMSFVGPRPAIPAEVERYAIWQRRRLRMRPGLTCLWAIRGRDRLDFERWMQMDLEYIDNWSLWMDLRILVLTVPVVLGGRGAH